jgi:hypothetical protein
MGKLCEICNSIVDMNEKRSKKDTYNIFLLKVEISREIEAKINNWRDRWFSSGGRLVLEWWKIHFSQISSI